MSKGQTQNHKIRTEEQDDKFMKGQTQNQTKDKLTKGQTHKLTKEQTHELTKGQTHKLTNGQTHKQTNLRKDKLKTKQQ